MDKVPFFKRRDTLAGIGLIATGAFAAYIASGYRIGEPQAMGPGFFPLALGVILAFFGTIILVSDMMRSGVALELPSGNLRTLISVLAAVIAFALSIRPLGLLPAVAIAVLISGSASPEAKPWLILTVAFFLCVVVYLIFILGLGMHVTPVNWAFFGNG